MGTARDEGLDAFNLTFYRSEPGDYLRTRLQLWMAAVARPAEIRDLLDGVEVAGIRWASAGDPAEAHEPDIDSFRTIDAMQLRHHAAETVLRLYVAHVAAPSAPWTDLAARTDFRKFKQLIRDKVIDTRPPPDDIGFAFFGSTSRPSGVDSETWTSVVDGTTAFVRAMAQVFLDDAPIYNAIKHGLGVAPGSARLIIGNVHLGRGESVDTVRRKQEDDHEDWTIVTQWVSVDEAIRVVHVATEMIDSIWRIGRRRCLPHLSDADEPLRLFWPVTLRPEHLEVADRSSVRSFSMHQVRVTRTQ